MSASALTVNGLSPQRFVPTASRNSTLTAAAEGGADAGTDPLGLAGAWLAGALLAGALPAGAWLAGAWLAGAADGDVETAGMPTEPATLGPAVEPGCEQQPHATRSRMGSGGTLNLPMAHRLSNPAQPPPA